MHDVTFLCSCTQLTYHATETFYQTKTKHTVLILNMTRELQFMSAKNEVHEKKKVANKRHLGFPKSVWVTFSHIFPIKRVGAFIREG